jgi:site-specific DNA recombinase
MPVTRAVVYTRVSTDRQADEGVSLDVQLELARKRCEERGWVLGEIYTDVMSGRSDRRPQFRRLEQDAKARRFDVVIVYKVDRLARSTATFYRIAQVLKDHDVSLVSLTEDLDLESASGKAMVGMLAIFAEMFSGQLSERVKAAMRANAAHGKHNGGVSPFGYRKVDGKLEIVPEEADGVREAFATFLRTRSIRGTVVHLNDLGIKTKRGGLWYFGGLKVILRNPVYCGMLAYGRSTILTSDRGKRKKRIDRSEWVVLEGACPAIISREEWDQAQEILNQNDGKSSRTKYGQLLYPWSGLIRCESCGAACTRYGSKGRLRPLANGEQKLYQVGRYICQSYSQQGRGTCFNYAAVPDTFLNSQVLPRVADIVDRALEQAKGKTKRLPSKRPDSHTKRISDLESKREREKELFRAGYSSFEEMAANIKRLDAQISEAMTVSQATSESLSISLPGKLMDLWPALTDADRGEMLRLLIERCEASPSMFAVYFKPYPIPGWPQDPVLIERVRRGGRGEH